MPEGWRASRSASRTSARKGDSLVSVTVFPLLKRYDPAKFGAVSKELDGIAVKLAAQAGATLSERLTTTVAGRKIRAYRFGSTRIGFVLDGKREYQLLCQSAEADGACDLLFRSFSLT